MSLNKAWTDKRCAFKQWDGTKGTAAKRPSWNVIVFSMGLALAAVSIGLPAHATQASDAETTLSDHQVNEPTLDAQAVYQRALELEWAGDYTAARTLYIQAADAEHGQASYQLGFLMMDGLGGPRDVVQARHYLRLAADNGVTLALVPLLYAFDDLSDPHIAPNTVGASQALLELARRDLGMAGHTIQFWSQPLRRQIQRDLQAAGFYRGAIDGLIGQGSLNALRAFARSSHPVPSVPAAGFEQMTITAQGIATTVGDPVPFDSLIDLASVRAAMPGLSVVATDDGGHWRISAGDDHLLDWLQSGLPDDRTPVFQLPGKPRGALLTLGDPLDTLPHDDLGACALRAPTTGPYEGLFLRRCETRVPGVQLLFLASNGPSPDLDAQHHQDPVMPVDERLVEIELTPPPTLRLAGN